MVIVPSASSVPAEPVSSSTASAAIPAALQQSAAGGSIPAGGAGTGAGAGSPCAACKFLRRKCQPDCVFAPYFPPENPQKFVQVHRVFGASNVTKILKELPPDQREEAVSSLAYEAEMRLHNPVHGCVGVISILQHRLRHLQQELARATCELLKYHQAATETAEASMAMVASNGVAGPADFVGNPVLNFINAGQATAASIIGGDGSMQQHDHFTTVQMLARSYGEEATTAARVGSNGGGGFAFGYPPSAMDSGRHGVVSGAGLGQIGGGPFIKPNNMAVQDEPHNAEQ